MTCERQRGQQAGFTLIEVIVVLAILGMLLGTAMPLAGAMIHADRRQEVRKELDGIAAALEVYWFDRGAWPTSLADATFRNGYLQTGIGGTATIDAWGGATYREQRTATQYSVWSVGENGVDNGVLNEEFVVTVDCGPPGYQKTRQRMRVIVEAIANRIESGGSVALAWTGGGGLRATLGLGAEYDNDGFGQPFVWDGTTMTLTSYGPNGAAGGGDDLTT